MTEESSADEERDAEAAPDDERSEDAQDQPADELAPARSDEEPDVEAAKAELEAVGTMDGEAEDDGDVDGVDPEASDAVPVDDDEPASADDAADDAVADEATGTGEIGEEREADDEPNPEDLVRDPDEPQVTSSLEQEAAEAETDDAATDPPVDADPQDETGAGGDGAAETGAGSAAQTTLEDPDAGAEATDDESDEAAGDEAGDARDESDAGPDHQPGVPDDVQKYDRFKKVDGSQYDRVNEFLRDRTYITAREWAIARLCSDFRTETGVEMTKIGENLPELVPFMTDTYTPQAVNQARSSFEDKVRTAGATFLYGAMCDFFTAEELDDVMYESTEVAKFLLEVEGVELSVEEELDAEDRISAVMRDVRSSSAELRHERCPDCGAELSGGD